MQLRIFLSRVTRFFEKKIYTSEEFAKKLGVKLGENCRINKNVNFGSEPYLINIGNDFYCSTNINFITHDGSINVFRNLSNEYKGKGFFDTINIGDNVFLGFGVTVLPGSLIGDNTIVGANSTVKGELKSNSVYAGTPARFICSIDEYIQRKREALIDVSGLNSFQKKKLLTEKLKII